MCRTAMEPVDVDRLARADGKKTKEKIELGTLIGIFIISVLGE